MWIKSHLELKETGLKGRDLVRKTLDLERLQRPGVPGSDKYRRWAKCTIWSAFKITGRTAATLKQAEKVNLGRDNVSGLKGLVINLTQACSEIMIHNLHKRTRVVLTCWKALCHKLGKMGLSNCMSLGTSPYHLAALALTSHWAV